MFKKKKSRCSKSRSASAAPYLPRPDVDHGFDGEDVARLHDTLGLVLGVVRDGRHRMEQLADAVAAVGLHHLAACPKREKINKIE